MNKRIHHNIYFVAWLNVVKEVEIETIASKDGFFILNLAQDLYDDYKIEYKKVFKKQLDNINKKVKELKS